METLFIPVLAGTVRDGRKSIHAARLIAEIGNTLENVETTLVDPRDFNFPGDGEAAEDKDPKYSAITKKADGFFIVTPEYNHSIPGSLKRMLDSEFDNYRHKPAAIAGVSSGQWGGVRAIEALASSVRTLGLVTLQKDMQFPKVQELFDDGSLQNEVYIGLVKKVWEELIWMTETLKWGRENIDNK